MKLKYYTPTLFLIPIVFLAYDMRSVWRTVLVGILCIVAIVYDSHLTKELDSEYETLVKSFYALQRRNKQSDISGEVEQKFKDYLKVHSSDYATLKDCSNRVTAILFLRIISNYNKERRTELLELVRNCYPDNSTVLKWSDMFTFQTSIVRLNASLSRLRANYNKCVHAELVSRLNLNDCIQDPNATRCVCHNDDKATMTVYHVKGDETFYAITDYPFTRYVNMCMQSVLEYFSTDAESLIDKLASISSEYDYVDKRKTRISTYTPSYNACAAFVVIFGDNDLFKELYDLKLHPDTLITADYDGSISLRCMDFLSVYLLRYHADVVDKALKQL